MSMDLPKSKIEVEENVDIRPHTTFGVGGVVRYFVEVGSSRDAVLAINFAKKNKIPYVIIAGGSNLVFGDGLLNMLVIKIITPVKVSSYISVKNNEVVCDASVSLMDLVSFTISRGLCGLEALSGIPGTVGGALVGNAGAYGQTISGPLKELEIFDGKKIRRLSKKECEFTYRDSIFKRKSWIVLSLSFSMPSGDREELEKKSREIIETRNKKYIPGIKCPGSFFKNILIENVPKTSLKFLSKDRDYYGKVPAWYFLDQVGARGMVEGGIKIADFHGNLLMNTGRATFKDVYTLAERLKSLVKEKFGIILEEEIRYIK